MIGSVISGIRNFGVIVISRPDCTGVIWGEMCIRDSRYTMVGYVLENTLTENGHVARGVCETDENGHLVGICERTRIEKHGEQAEYTEDDGKTSVSYTHLYLQSKSSTQKEQKTDERYTFKLWKSFN